MSLAAAASALIGIKINYSKTALTVHSFPYFEARDLVSCEKLILEKLNYCIDPCYSPVCFIKLMLRVWHGHRNRHGELWHEATNLANKFILFFESLQYSSMTIAVSALLLAFLKLGVDSSEWLHSLPNRCYTTVDASGCKVVDKCLESFRRCNQMTMRNICYEDNSNNSPTTVTAMIENKLSIQAVPAIPKPSITPTSENLGVVNRDIFEDGNGNDLVECVAGSTAAEVECQENIGYTFAPIHCSSSQRTLDRLELKRPVPRTFDGTSNSGDRNSECCEEGSFVKCSRKI